jgi:glutathione S-transferase
LELYHHGSSVCAAKARFAIMEKGVEWTGHYIDILKGDQFTPEYRAINPKAVVPALVHDGRIVTESTVIIEYIDDAFPQKPLKPKDPFERAQMRLWLKTVDDYIHPTCGELTFCSCHRHIIARLGPEGVEKFLEGTPGVSVTPGWRKRKRELVELGFEAPGVADKVKLHVESIEKANADLEQSEWLVGDSFSLADIALTPYLNRLDMLGMDGIWKGCLPHLEAWWDRIRAMPNFVPCFLDYCPPDLTADLKQFGTQSWPEVKNIAGI